MEEKEYIAGRHAVREALLAGRPLNKLLVAKGIAGTYLSEIQRLARERGVPVQQVERVWLDSLVAGAAHQGVVAIAAVKGYATVEEILAAARPEEPFLILLNEVTDPRNLGAVLRTADAAGVHGVVIPRHRSCALTPAVAKAAAGAVEHVRVARVTNMARTIDYLKQQGIWVVGAESSAPHIYWDVRLTGPIALVIGGEDKGLGRLVREKCDQLVSLPMQGRVTSLNTSVAAALLAYEVLRQRRQVHGGIPHR